MIKFILRYFILCGTILNGTLFLNSLSDSSLLMYKNTTDFSVLIL